MSTAFMPICPAGGIWTGPQELVHTDWRYRFAWDGAVDTAGIRDAVWAMSEYPYSDSQLLFAYHPTGGSWRTPGACGRSKRAAASTMCRLRLTVLAMVTRLDQRPEFRHRCFLRLSSCGWPVGSNRPDQRRHQRRGAMGIKDCGRSYRQRLCALARPPQPHVNRLPFVRRHHDIINSATRWLSRCTRPRKAHAQAASSSAPTLAVDLQYVSDAVSFSGSAVTFAVTVPYPGDTTSGRGRRARAGTTTPSRVGRRERTFPLRDRPIRQPWTWGWEPVHPEGQPVEPISLSSGTHILTRRP